MWSFFLWRATHEIRKRLRTCFKNLFQSRAREEALLATLDHPEQYAPLRSQLGWSPPFYIPSQSYWRGLPAGDPVGVFPLLT